MGLKMFTNLQIVFFIVILKVLELFSLGILLQKRSFKKVLLLNYSKKLFLNFLLYFGSEIEWIPFLNFQGHSTFGFTFSEFSHNIPNSVGCSFYGYQTLCRVTKIGILILMSQILAFDSVPFAHPLLSLGCCYAWRLVS